MITAASLNCDVNRRVFVGGVALSMVASQTRALEKDSGVDAALFFRDEETLSAHLSPDGKQVALRTVAKHKGVMLSVLDLDSMRATVLHSQEGADACDVSWANASRLLFSIEARRTPEGRIDSGPGLFAINSDGTAFRQLVERQEIVKLEKIDGGGISGVVPTGAAPQGVGGAAMGQEGMGFKQIADAPNVKNIREVDSERLQEWNTFLLSSVESATSDAVMAFRTKGLDAKLIDVLAINVRTGRAKPMDLPGVVERAFVDAVGDLRMAVVREHGQLRMAWKDAGTGAWRTLNDCSPEPEEDWGVKHIDPRGTVYISARRGQDKLALWAYNVSSGQWSASALVQSPLFDVDAQVLASRGRVLGYRFTIDAEVTQWLDAEMKDLQQQVDQLLPRTINRIGVAGQGTGTRLLIEAFSDRQPKVFLMYERSTRKLTRLGSLRPDMLAKDMATMDLQRFSARDGLNVPVWVTLPKNASGTVLPAVILLSDGINPTMGTWAWDAMTQFLVARGFVVLKPELRGTRGLGLRHFQAGNQEVRRRVTEDVIDTVQWAMGKGLAQSGRVALVGAGVGAASGLVALSRNPAPFRCAAIWAGDTDFTALLPGPWLTALKQPVFMAYGEKAGLLSFSNAAKLAKALQSHNPDGQSVAYKDEGKALRDIANQVDFNNRLARFLERHLSVL